MSIEESDKAAAAVAVGPRVTLDDIKGKIEHTIFSLADIFVPEEDEAPEALSTLTICVLVMRNGFTFVGTSACVFAANFNAELGQKLAYEDAIGKAWSHEGYLLQERLYRGQSKSTEGENLG